MTIRLLTSPVSKERLAARIESISQEHQAEGIQFVDHDNGDFEFAFISRDITGSSTKHKVLPATQGYYDALLHSKSLRWVHVHSVGIDRYVYQELLRRGVEVTPSIGANTQEVAQTALGGLLALARGFPRLATAQRQRQWAPAQGEHLPRQLSGQTAVIVGWGAIAQQVARYLEMLQLNIIVARHDALKPARDFPTLSYTKLNTVLPLADWVLVCCPLTEETRNLIGKEQLALMKPQSYLINVARGEIIDEAALTQALNEKRLAGAFLDVFAHEPLPESSALWEMDNVIVSPHSAGFSDGNAARVDAIFLEKLTRKLQR